MLYPPLLRNGVFFLPWIGEHYKKGLNGRRLLILGESHWARWVGEKHPLERKFTRSCVREAVRREGDTPFFKNIEQALLNEKRKDGWPPNGGKALWERVAFCNFVQSPVRGGPRHRPKRQDWEQARAPFRAVLEQLRPDRVLVCGTQLWGGMETIMQTEDFLHDAVQAYRLADGTQVWCLATPHPSSGQYSWSRLHPVIAAFLDDPRKAAEMLQNPQS